MKTDEFDGFSTDGLGELLGRALFWVRYWFLFPQENHAVNTSANGGRESGADGDEW
jgi:hypothetical protein